MNGKHIIYINELLKILMLPVFMVMVLPIQYEYLLMIYYLIVVVLSFSEVQWVQSKYGDIKHISSRTLCATNCMILLLVGLTALYYIASILMIHVALFSLLQSLLVLIFVKRHINVVFYTEGLLYKGRYFDYEGLREGVLVKNYQSLYEIHLKQHVIVLNKQELAFTQV